MVALIEGKVEVQINGPISFRHAMSAALTKVVKKGKCRVFIADDHCMLRQGIKAAIELESDLIVCGEAESAPIALQAVEKLKPDVVLVDLALKDSSGLELIKDLQARYPGLKILVLSMQDEMFYAERALHAGAKGYINKEAGVEQVIAGIRQVMAGKPFLSDGMRARIISKSLVNPGLHPTATPECLSDRELEVLELIGSGFGSGEIAAQLFLSVKTIESHRAHIKQKLGLSSGSQLVKYAFHWMQSRKKT